MPSQKIQNISSNNGWVRWSKQIGIADESLKAFLSDSNYAEKTLANYETYLNNATTSTAKFSLAAKAGSIAMQGLSIAGNMIAFTAISMLVGKGIEFINDLVHANENAINSANELSQSYQEQTSKISDNITTIRGYYDEFETLSQGVSDSGENISLSSDEYQRYHDIVNEITSLSPSLVQGYDAEGNAIANKNSLIERSIELLKEQQRQELLKQTTDENNKTIAKGAIGTYKKAINSEQDATNSVMSEILKIVDTNRVTKDENNNIISNVDYDFVKRFAEKFNLSNVDIYSGIDTQDAIYKMLSDVENAKKVANALRYDTTSLTDFLKDDANLTDLNKELKEYVLFANEAKEASQGFSEQLILNAQANDSYSNLTTEQQELVNAYANSFKITKDTTVGDFESMANQIDQFVTDLSHNSFIQPKLEKLTELQLDSETMSVPEYIEQYKSIINDIVNEIPNLDEEAKNKIKVSLEYDIESQESKLNDVKAKLKEKGLSDDDLNKLLSWKGVDQERLDIYYKIANDPDSQFSSFDEFKDKVKEMVAETKSAIDSEEFTDPFASLIIEEKDGSLSEQFEAYTARISNLKTALDGLRSGSFSSSDIASLLQDFPELADDAYNLEEAIESLINGSESGFLNTLNEQIKELKKSGQDTTSLENFRDVVKSMTSDVEGLTSQYQKYLEATSSANSGDIYVGMVDGLKNAKELYDQGLVGTDDFKTYAKMLSPSGADDAENFIENYNNLKKYFDSDSSKGLKNFLNHLKEIGNGYATLNKKTNEWTFNIKDTEQAAKDFGIGLEPFEAMLNRLKDYGFDIEFTSLIDKQQKSTQSVTKANKELNKLKKVYEKLSNSHYKAQLGADISEYEDSISKAKEDIDTIPEEVITQLTFEYSVAELMQKVQEARNGMNAGASKEKQVEYNSTIITNQDEVIEIAKEKLQEAGIEIPVTISGLEEDLAKKKEKIKSVNESGDPDAIIQVQGEVDLAQGNLLHQLDLLAEDNNINIPIGLDTINYEHDAEIIKEDKFSDKVVKVDSDTKKAMEELHKVRQYELENKTVSVSAEDHATNVFDTVREKLFSLPTKKEISITTTQKTVYSSPTETGRIYKDNKGNSITGYSKLNGTVPSLHSRALAIGSLSQRNITAGYSGETLVGELGAELLVRGNRWTLIGEHGAEFVNIQPGDVVFNHLQTQQLMNGKRTFSRGIALKDGTAFKGGNTVTGGGSFSGGASNSNSSSSSDKNKNKSSNNTKNSKTSSKSKSSTVQDLDWIANSVRNVQQAYENLNTQLTNTIGWDAQKKKQREVIKQSEKLLITYKKAAQAYKKEFNSATKGLSQTYIKQIQSGKKFTIEDFKGENRNKIYDKITNAQSIWQNYQESHSNYLSQKGKLREENRNLIQIDIDRYSAKAEASEAKLETQTNYKSRIKTLKEIYTYKNKEYELEKKLAETTEERKKIEYEQLKFQQENKDARIQENIDHYSSKVEENEAKLETQYNYKDRIKTLKTIRSYKNKEFEQEKKLAKTAAERNKIIQEQLKYNQENTDLQVEELKNYYTNKVSAKEALLETQVNYKNRIKTLKDILAAKNKEFEQEKKLAKTAAERKQIEYEQLQYQRENAMLRFQEVQNRYDKSSNLNENKRNLYQSILSNIESQGYDIGSVFYERIAGLSEFQITRLEREKQQLQTAFEKNVKDSTWIVGSDEWYEGLQAIYDVEEAIANCNSQIIDCNNSLRQLKWDQFDRLLSQFQQLSDESDFLINLLSSKELVDEKLGGLTQAGDSTNALHLQNYNTYMAQSDKLKSEIDALNSEIEKQSVIDQNLVSRRDELISQRYEMIESAESEKQAIIDLVSEGYESQISAMQELTDKNKELLEKEKERHDYEKQINEKSKSISTLEKQIAALSLSTDRKDIAQRLKLEQELAEQKEELEETQYEHSIETQQNALDDSMELYEEKIRNYLKNTDQVFTDTLNHVNNTSSQILSNIESEAKDVGYSISENIINTWTNTTPIVEYGSTFWDVINGESGVLTAINSITEAWNKANEAYENYSKTTANESISDSRESESVQSKDNAISSILGKSSSNREISGSSKINQYVTSLGYEQLTYTDMVNLSKELGLKTTSADDFRGEWETVKENYSSLYTAFQKYMVNNFLNSQEKQNYTEEEIKNAKTTQLNKYLMKNGYKKLTPTEQVKLAQLLGITGITKDNYSKSENIEKVLSALKKTAGFSQGGEVKSNRYQKVSTDSGLAGKINSFVRQNNDDGIATVQRGEVILSGKQSSAFKNFIAQYANIQPFSTDLLNAITAVSSSKENIQPIEININTPLVHVDSVRNDADIKQINNIAKTTVIEQLMSEFKKVRTR